MRSIILTLGFCALLPTLAQAQDAKASPGVGLVHGFVTTQAGTVRLAGATVVIATSGDQPVAQLLSDEAGRFSVAGLVPGRYTVSASLAGFVTTTLAAEVTGAQATELSVDLPIEGLSQTVEVVAISSVVSNEGTLSPSDTLTSRELDEYAPRGGLQASLRLLASIIEVPGGVSIKGGRPSQVGVQLGPGTLVDPTTGQTKVSLPDDAVDSVSVLANPYAVEYGRFSSGLVVIQTRRAGDRWRARINNIDPTFRTKRSAPLTPLGIGGWAPRIEIGGPLIPGRLFLEQTAQYRYSAADVASLPQTLVHTSQSFSSFTRVDANLSARHALVVSGGVFPGVSRDATLGTFTPPDATIDLNMRANEWAVTERAVWTDRFFGETTLQVHDHQTDVLPHGSAPMRLRPETTHGNFFNQQHRDTATYQLIESIAVSRDGPEGTHLFKFGIDVLHNRYDGWNRSRPVLVERSDGRLVRRLDFPVGLSRQTLGSTDVALFAQDRFQPSARWYLEFGGRLDRDGVVDRINLTPRVGTAVLLNESGGAVLRGGFGLFYERTPSTAGTFDEFESPVDTRLASDGLTPLGPPVRFVNATATLETPRSRTWDLGYDHRLNKLWSLHIGAVDRQGSRELILEPRQTGSTAELVLSSTGRSSYRGLEVGVHFTRGSTVDLNVSYTRSSSRADLNALTNNFDTIPWPVVGANEYGPAGADAPNRLLARGRMMPSPRWLLLGLLDWRSGLPYSVVNDTLDFVGPRNGFRFPTFVRVEVGFERRVKILKFQPWIGVRVLNALASFLPTDVQNNVGSPAFGSFYNSEIRQYRVQLRFER